MNILNKEELREKLSKIKLFATDFDGIHTDGCVYVGDDGKEFVKCSRKDGLGIEMLKKAGMNFCVISKEKNPVVEMRCRKLGIVCYQGVENGEGKLSILKRIADDMGLSSENVLYMGDDLNDLDILNFVGVAITVADGDSKVIDICHHITKNKGGEHAIREVCDIILDTDYESI